MDRELTIIGTVRSPLTDRSQAPKNEAEGAPPAFVHIDPAYEVALEGLQPGMEIVLVTWLHQADRNALRVHPRGDASRPKRGVFATRSPDRPNPLGLHTVRLLDVQGTTLSVDALEAIDGTPVVDVKPLAGRKA